MNVLLIGNPNVGKSAIFTHLTGVSVITSNYPGTTVNYKKGYLDLNKADCFKCDNCTKNIRKNCKVQKDNMLEVIDVPGTYRLDPECDAEKVATDMIMEGDILVNVIDATNIERNLILTMQLLELNKPVIVVLNMWDEARHKGIEIDNKKLQKLLNAPVVCTSGLSGEGIKNLIYTINRVKDTKRKGQTVTNRWDKIGEIVTDVQNLTNRKHTFLERLQDLSIHPLLGLPTAIVSLFLVFKIIITTGEFLVGLTGQLFSSVYTPLILKLNTALGDYEVFRYILFGNIGNGGIEYESAMGVLTTGVFMTFGLVFPYLLVFYIVLGFLEDLGYLARIAVIFDKGMHTIGLHGFSVIPMLLAFGCNVPGILAIRNLESRRERFITALLTSITIPCMAQTAIIFSILGNRGTIPVLTVFSVLFSIWIMLGALLKKHVAGRTTTLIMEIPPYRMPGFKIQTKTLMMRMKGFLAEAVPYVLGGILFINILTVSGAIDLIADFFSPIVTSLFGLPEKAVTSFMIGVVRKDAAVALLEPLNLTTYQLINGVTLLIIYFPCIATYTVMAKELKLKDTLKATAITFGTTLVVGGLMNLLHGRVMSSGLFTITILVFAIIVSYVIQHIKKQPKV